MQNFIYIRQTVRAVNSRVLMDHGKHKISIDFEHDHNTSHLCHVKRKSKHLFYLVARRVFFFITYMLKLVTCAANTSFEINYNIFRYTYMSLTFLTLEGKFEESRISTGLLGSDQLLFNILCLTSLAGANLTGWPEDSVGVDSEGWTGTGGCCSHLHCAPEQAIKYSYQNFFHKMKLGCITRHHFSSITFSV